MQRKWNYKYNDDYTSKCSVKCDCGHVINIYNRSGTEICKYYGKLNFVNKKKEFEYRLKRKLVK